MGRKPARKEPEKPHRLTFSELSNHDDVCSDVMIDNAFFKSRIRKNKPKPIPVRGIKEEDVPKILLHKLIVGKDVASAEKSILALSGVKRYRSSLKSKAEQENFLKHFHKYVQMYSTDCPWEVSTTNRYTITTYEAAVTARKRVKQGEPVKYLVGTTVPLTAEESVSLDVTNRNFSIVVSSRKKCSSIFLGPARFANHDCDANARLVTHGTEGMDVVAVKNIEVGDEITVSYGDDYFGPNNIDCLCYTCEMLERNGWTARTKGIDVESDSSTPPSPIPMPERLSNGMFRKRKRESDSSTSQLTPKRQKVLPSPSKLHQSWTPPSTSASEAEANFFDSEILVHQELATAEATISPPRSPRQPGVDAQLISKSDEQPEQGAESELRRRKSSASARSKKVSKLDKMTTRLLGAGSARHSVLPSPSSTGSSSSENDLEAKGAISAATTIKVEAVEVTKVETDDTTQTIVRNDEVIPTIENSPEDVIESVPAAITSISTIEVTKTVHADAEPTASTASSVLPSVEVTNTLSTTKISVRPVSDNVRVPGDYILTRKLLAQPHDRWVQCHNLKCKGFFIQPNGYQTRRECPRCERHSMLYGFPWPKTDSDPRAVRERDEKLNVGRGRKKDGPKASAYKRAGRSGKGSWVEGGGDEEERVMDHRTVHRFVLPEEEKELTRKGLLVEAEMARARGEDGSGFTASEWRAGSRSRMSGTESVMRDGSESVNGSTTPDGGPRRSHRFVTEKAFVYLK